MGVSDPANWVVAICSIGALYFAGRSVFGRDVVADEKRKFRLLYIEELRNKHEI